MPPPAATHWPIRPRRRRPRVTRAGRRSPGTGRDAIVPYGRQLPSPASAPAPADACSPSPDEPGARRGGRIDLPDRPQPALRRRSRASREPTEPRAPTGRRRGTVKVVKPGYCFVVPAPSRPRRLLPDAAERHDRGRRPPRVRPRAQRRPQRAQGGNVTILPRAAVGAAPRPAPVPAPAPAAVARRRQAGPAVVERRGGLGRRRPGVLLRLRRGSASRCSASAAASSSRGT